MGDLAHSEALAHLILDQIPDNLSARLLLAELLLSQGRFGEGWPYYEARIAYRVAVGGTPQAVPSYPRWNGEQLAGKSIVIWPEQGLGDQIQFSRFVPALVALGARVTLLVGPELAPILQHLGAEVMTIVDGIHIPPHDFWTYPGSLPLHLGFLPSEPYLEAQFPSPSTTLRIGLAWQGNSSQSNDSNRRATPEIFRPLLGQSTQLVSLSPAQTNAKNFAQTAAMIDQLDLGRVVI